MTPLIHICPAGGDGTFLRNVENHPKSTHKSAGFNLKNLKTLSISDVTQNTYWIAKIDTRENYTKHVVYTILLYINILLLVNKIYTRLYGKCFLVCAL
jgi:NAD kinase